MRTGLLSKVPGIKKLDGRKALRVQKPVGKRGVGTEGDEGAAGQQADEPEVDAAEYVAHEEDGEEVGLEVVMEVEYSTDNEESEIVDHPAAKEYVHEE